MKAHQQLSQFTAGPSRALQSPSPRTSTLFDKEISTSPSHLIDVEFYNVTVLQLSPTISEDDLDDRVALEAQGLGLPPIQSASDPDGITSSKSIATVRSDSLNQGSIQSQSTAPTSCDSSAHRHTLVQPSPIPEQYTRKPDHSPAPSDEDVKKPRSPFRRGFRKMTGFRKRRSATMTSSALSSISSDADTNASGELSITSDLRSPLSLKSSKSSWSQPLSAAKISFEHHHSTNLEALKRSMECKEMLDLRIEQLDEKARFLRYQVSLVSEIRSQCEAVKAIKRTERDRFIAEQIDKKDRSIEDLEARQLEEELKIQNEHDMEKRAVLIRLRHMEAYCQNPTPPQTPVDPTSGRPSMDSVFPERKVTDKDYHNLAQQYRERDAMDTLHTSKINVLRGKQKKAVENLMNKKEREIEKLEQELQKELSIVDQEFSNHEADLMLVLGQRRKRLEARWRATALIERTKLERTTGLSYAPLPDVVATEEPDALSVVL